jgi:thymidylate synthase
VARDALNATRLTRVFNPPTMSSFTSATPGSGTAREPHDEYQYIDLIRTVLDIGAVRPDRTGTGTLSLFAPPNLRFSLANHTLPLLTTKRTFLKGIVAELLWFIRGGTDSALLSAQGVRIWDGNGSRAFLDSRGLSHRREGDLGPVYGFQWRHFGAEYVDADADYSGKGVDQLKECIEKIKHNPTDRRIILSAWNPAGKVDFLLISCHCLTRWFRHSNPRDGTASLPHALSILRPSRAGGLTGRDEERAELPDVSAVCRSGAGDPVQHRVVRAAHAYVRLSFDSFAFAEYSSGSLK